MLTKTAELAGSGQLYCSHLQKGIKEWRLINKQVEANCESQRASAVTYMISVRPLVEEQTQLRSCPKI